MNTKDDQWLEALYKETFPQVAKIVHQLGVDIDTAKDLFHDALIIYLEKQGSRTLNIHTSAKAYLIGITKILWAKKFRNDCRNIALNDQDDSLAVPEDFYTPEEERAAPLLHYLQVAGKKCLQLLQAFYYEQLSIQEIAIRFGYRTRHSTTVQKYKCLEKVREQIKRSELYEEAIT